MCVPYSSVSSALKSVYIDSLEVFEEESVTLHIGRELQHHQPAAFWCVFTVTAPWGLQKDVAVPREKFQARLW